MAANPTDQRSNRVTRFAIIGVEFFSPIVGGMIAGYYLGEYFHQPWLGLAGLLGGIFLGFYRLIAEIILFQRSL